MQRKVHRRSDDKEFDIFFERRRRAKENGLKRKVIRMVDEERTEKLIAELSEDMETWKRQWYNLARMYEQFRREDLVDEVKGEYRRTIEQTEPMMRELDHFLFGKATK